MPIEQGASPLTRPGPISPNHYRPLAAPGAVGEIRVAALGSFVCICFQGAPRQDPAGQDIAYPVRLPLPLPLTSSDHLKKF